MHLAEINVARLRYPLDDPRVADFVDNLDAVNALAERSEGFIWRLKDESGNATQIAAYDDPMIIVNMSVWRSAEDLHAFAYRTVHRRFVQRRKEWFEPLRRPLPRLVVGGGGRLPRCRRGAPAARSSPADGANSLRLHLPEALRSCARISGRWSISDETGASAGVRFRLCG